MWRTCSALWRERGGEGGGEGERGGKEREKGERLFLCRKEEAAISSGAIYEPVGKGNKTGKEAKGREGRVCVCLCVCAVKRRRKGEKRERGSRSSDEDAVDLRNRPEEHGKKQTQCPSVRCRGGVAVAVAADKRETEKERLSTTSFFQHCMQLSLSLSLPPSLCVRALMISMTPSLVHGLPLSSVFHVDGVYELHTPRSCFDHKQTRLLSLPSWSLPLGLCSSFFSRSSLLHLSASPLSFCLPFLSQR